MLLFHWILTAFVLAAVCCFFQNSPWARKRKRPPPGPRKLPVLGNLHMLGKNPHQDLHHLAKKHGPIMYMQLGLVPAIVVSSPDAVEMFLKTHDLVFAGRPYSDFSWYFHYGQRNLVFARYGPYWRNMRKLCTMHLLSNQKINSVRSMRREELGLLIESIRQEASNGATVDLSAFVSSLSANITCLMVFGKKFMDKDFDNRGFNDIIQEAAHLAGIPNLGDNFPFLGLLDLQGLTRRIKALSKVFDNFLEKIIDEHLQTQHHNQTRDFVDTLLAIFQSGEAEFEFDLRHVKAVLLDMLIASVDTSAAAVEFTFAELLRHTHVMKKLQKEIAGKVGTYKMVEESDLESLKFLDMVVKEAMRLHPVVPLLPRESLEDCIVDGFTIKKKSRIIINARAIGRDPKAWPDPDRFIPERFIGKNIDLRGHDFQLIPFGSGRRICPGLQMGLTFVRLVVAQLAHCFDWELPNNMMPSDLDMTEAFGLVTSRANHLMAVPTFRLNKWTHTEGYGL